MKPIQELYQEFIEKLRAVIDSQVNMSSVQFRTTKRYLTVTCYHPPVENGGVMYRVHYGHVGSNRRVLMHFNDVRWLQKFIYAAIWKNPTYSTLRNTFKKHDALDIAKAQRRRAKQRQKLDERGFFAGVVGHINDEHSQTTTIHVTKEHGGIKFVTEN